MKKLYLLILFCVFNICFPQIILSETETSGRTVEDPNVIIFAPGFSFRSDNSKTFITGSAGLTFATIMMYFMACTPRPLTKSKVRKLFESIRLLPKPVTA